jgi:hypothetical protein
MADPFGDQDHGPGGIGKRPSSTIEGRATEISIEPTTEEAARAEPDAPQNSAESEREASISGATAGAGEAEDDRPRARASLPELKTFVTHLAAGLLGGLVGVIALAIAWGLPTGQTGGKAPDLAKLDQRIAKLEATPPASGNAGEVAELDTRMKALEQRFTEPSTELSDLTSRVAQLETALKAVGDAAKEGRSVADAAAIGQQISEAEQRLQAKIDAALAGGEAVNASTIQDMQSAIAELKAKIAALADAELGTGSTSELGPEVSTLSERVAKLEAALPQLARAVGKDAAGTKSAAAAIAFANLRAAISEGRPFATELDTISTLSPAAADLGVLPAYAEKGIPTVPELARSFATAKDAALAAAAVPVDDSFLASLMASAESLVKIRRVDAAATGDTPSAVLARAGAELDQGDLAAAVKEVGALQGAPHDAFSVWLDQARARLSADETLKRLEGLLLVSVSGGAEPAQP